MIEFFRKKGELPIEFNNFDWETIGNWALWSSQALEAKNCWINNDNYRCRRCIIVSEIVESFETNDSLQWLSGHWPAVSLALMTHDSWVARLHWILHWLNSIELCFVLHFESLRITKLVDCLINTAFIQFICSNYPSATSAVIQLYQPGQCDTSSSPCYSTKFVPWMYTSIFDTSPLHPAYTCSRGSAYGWFIWNPYYEWLWMVRGWLFWCMKFRLCARCGWSMSSSF